MATQAAKSALQAVRPTAYNISPVRLTTAPNRQRLSVAEVCDAYMGAYAGRDQSRPQVLARWCAYLGDWLLVDLDADAVAHVVDDIAQTPVRRYVGRDEAGEPVYRETGLPAPASINRFKAVFSAVLTWAQQKRLTPKGWHNPCREVPSRTVRNARVRFLTEAERTRLLRVCRISAWPKLYLLVMMALVTGARRSELMGLRYRDLDLQAGTAHLYETKNGEDRVLPLTDAVVDEIRRFGRAPHPDALLFHRVGHLDKPFGFQSAWKKALAEARVEDFRFHDLRHSCASYLAQSGASLLEIADVLGHRQLDVTRRYSHLTVDRKAQTVRRVLGNIA